MAAATRFLASAFVGSLLVVWAGNSAWAQVGTASAPSAAAYTFSPPSGTLTGIVHDEHGAPVTGAVVSALGGETTVAVTDSKGRFEFASLAAGPYLLRVHLAGYLAARAQRVQVRPNARTTFGLSVRHAGATPPVLAAGFAGVEEPDPAPTAAASDRDLTTDPVTPLDPGETSWRLRHLRRSILKEVSIVQAYVADDTPDVESTPAEFFGRALGAPSRAAVGFFVDSAFTGQVNLLTTGSFDSPQQLFSPDVVARNIAYVKVGAPAGERGDWTVRGALNQADISSWIIAGSYVAHTAGDRHRYDVGLSYSTQHYDGGNLLALRDIPDASRNVGTVYGYDRFAVAPGIALSYGVTYGRYDYLDTRSLVSPRAEVALNPDGRLRFTAGVGRRALAPGAEEFLPPGDTGVWLPPQRTFSSLTPGALFTPERTTHIGFGVERDFGASTIVVRAFRQHVDDQMVTLFGTEMPGQPAAKLGHYLVATAGDVDTLGYTAGLRTMVASRVRGSLEYSVARTQIVPLDDGDLMVAAPTIASNTGGRVHDLRTRVETEVPETATRVLVVYRLSNGFSRSSSSVDSSRARLEGRFDVQVRQSLPFMNFSSARWEMLLAVRNFFRESAPEESVYDEMFVVRPPKRVVGGVSLRF